MGLNRRWCEWGKISILKIKFRRLRCWHLNTLIDQVWNFFSLDLKKVWLNGMFANGRNEKIPIMWNWVRFYYFKATFSWPSQTDFWLNKCRSFIWFAKYFVTFQMSSPSSKPKYEIFCCTFFQSFVVVHT